MSVLTVTNTAIAPGPFADAPSRSHSQLPVELPTSYSGPFAQREPATTSNAHRHSRTVSSSILPTDPFTTAKPAAAHRYPYAPSRPTTSTSSPPPPPPQRSPASMQRQGTTGSATTTTTSLPRRSTSGRSTATNGPSSYVALMRKQKATVWCDRAQAMDARMAAQQKAAKQRALTEVVGPNSQRTSTITSGGVVGKIRHGGVAKAPHYTAPNTIGAGVPTRLLAFDMQGEEDQEGRVLGDNSMVHARTDSGKSSINSAQYRSGYPRAQPTPPDGGSPAHEDIPEAGETPTAATVRNNYFDSQKSDEEDSFGEFKEMAGPNSKQALDAKAKDDGISRRGSVDERTTSMTSNQRLYITNPDRD